MFGFRNYNGSCWVNACLQGVFRIPDVQDRYKSAIFEKGNVVDECLNRIWNSKGEEGLKEFFESVRTKTMPAGHGIGDSHELLQELCDKLPYLDTLCRFKIADTIECKSCHKKSIKEDSVTEFSISNYGENSIPISECISKTVLPQEIAEWKCEDCKQSGCIKQQLIGSFPDVMVFHLVPTRSSVEYSSMLVLNKRQYALLAVICYNGSHWWAYGRNMPPGNSWYTLNDTAVTDHGPKQFPLTSSMRLLIYYRLKE